MTRLNIIFKIRKGEPNNALGNSSYIREQCITSYNIQHKCLNDYTCGNALPVVCEKKYDFMIQPILKNKK